MHFIHESGAIIHIDIMSYQEVNPCSDTISGKKYKIGNCIKIAR